MKKLLVILFLIPFFNSYSQEQSNQDKAVEIFDEGASLSMKAEIYHKGNKPQQSYEFNKQAIEKFLEVVKLDPAHPIAPSALGHSYYLVREYKEGIKWFEKALDRDTTMAINYREYGLCKINEGDLKGGKAAIDKSLKIDSSSRTVDVLVNELYNIGSLAFKFGNGYEQQGEAAKGTIYKKFAVSVLFMAHEFDPRKTKVMEKIAEFATLLGDERTANYFNSKLKK